MMWDYNLQIYKTMMGFCHFTIKYSKDSQEILQNHPLNAYPSSGLYLFYCCKRNAVLLSSYRIFHDCYSCKCKGFFLFLFFPMECGCWWIYIIFAESHALEQRAVHYLAMRTKNEYRITSKSMRYSCHNKWRNYVIITRSWRGAELLLVVPFGFVDFIPNAVTGEHGLVGVGFAFGVNGESDKVLLRQGEGLNSGGMIILFRPMGQFGCFLKGFLRHGQIA